MYRLLLLSLSLNYLGVFCGPITSYYKSLEDSAHNANLSCKTLRNSDLFTPKPQFLSNCNYSPKDLTISEDQFLCALYYNNFLFLCDEMNNVPDELSNKFLPKSTTDTIEGIPSVCTPIVGNKYFYDGFEKLKEFSLKKLNSQSCVVYCMGSDYQMSPMCKAIASMITATEKVISLKALNVAKPHVTTTGENKKETKTQQLGTRLDHVPVNSNLNDKEHVIDHVDQDVTLQKLVTGQKDPLVQPPPVQQQDEQIVGVEQQSFPSKTLIPMANKRINDPGISEADKTIYDPAEAQTLPKNIAPVIVHNSMHVDNNKADTNKESENLSNAKTQNILDVNNKLPPNQNFKSTASPILDIQHKDPHTPVETKVALDSPNQNKLKIDPNESEVNKVAIESPNQNKLKIDPNEGEVNAGEVKEVKEANQDPIGTDNKLSTPSKAIIPQIDKKVIDNDVAKDGAALDQEQPVLEPNKYDKNDDIADEYGNQNQDFEDPDNDREMDISPVRENPKSSEVKTKPVENPKPHEIIEDDITLSANYQNQNIDDSDSYFFSYFMLVCIMFICGYVTYHNKQKILALVVEGRQGRRNSRSRRPNSANYRKLDSNLEEAVTSSCTKNTTQVIY